jgi:hypothetical protein
MRHPGLVQYPGYGLPMPREIAQLGHLIQPVFAAPRKSAGNTSGYIWLFSGTHIAFSSGVEGGRDDG